MPSSGGPDERQVTTYTERSVPIDRQEGQRHTARPPRCRTATGSGADSPKATARQGSPASTRTVFPCGLRELDEHGARYHHVLDTTATGPRPDDPDDHRRDGNVGIGVFGDGPPRSQQRERGLAGREIRDDVCERGQLPVRRPQGTRHGVAPSAVQAATSSRAFSARATGPLISAGTRGGMFVSAAENWTNTAQGTRLNFNTTANGTNTPATRMTIDDAATSASARRRRRRPWK